PEQGLAALSSATPAQADAALGGVQVAAAADGAAQTEATQASLPEATVGEEVAAKAMPGKGSGAAGASTPKQETAGAAPQTKPAPTPTPSAGNAADKVAAPQIPKPAQGAEPSEADKARLNSSLSRLPGSDPGLKTRLGDAPQLQLSGDADPARMASQKAKADQAVAAARTKEADEVAKPMGEDSVRPTVGKAEIKARALKPSAAAGGGAAGGAGGGGGAAAGGGSGDAARGILAEELKGGEVRAAMAAASGKAAAAKAEAQAQIAASNAATQAQVGELKNQAATEQEAARAKVKGDAQAARADYTQKQEAAVSKLDKTQTDTLSKTSAKVSEEKRKGEEEASAQIEEGDRLSEEKQQEVEGEVEEKKQEAQAQTEEKGFFGRLADDVGAWFDKQKKWISDKVEAGKKWIKETADRFKKYAAEKIDAARDAVTGFIKDAGDVLIAASDTLLADFPGARDFVRGKIESGVEWGVNKTNEIADDAKNKVNQVVDGAAALAEGALEVGGKVANAAIDSAKATTVGALNAADKAAQALGVLKILIEDVASNPGGWISNLASSAKDGVKNHLAGAMKAAIKQWWEGKVESVLGVGAALWDVLKKGGLGLKEIGSMAWAAIKAAIPPALIQLVIEKLVSMIVPAAGAVMAIIEGLQAAWGSVSAMLGAVQKAIGFLKAVKGGGAGPQFAQLVAAAAIVVIDFVSNWLLQRLGKGIAKIGGKIKGIAQKLMAKFKTAAKKIKGKGKGKKGKSKKKDKKARDRKAKKLREERKKKKSDKDGKKKDDPNKKKQDKEKEKQERLDKAMKAIRPKLHALLKRGVSKIRLNVQLKIWKVLHRLSALKIEGNQIVAKVNPTATEQIEKIPPSLLGQTLQQVMGEVEAAFFQHLKTASPDDVRKNADEARKAVSGGTEDRLGLPAHEQVSLVRDILAGNVPMPAGKPKLDKPGKPKRDPTDLRSPIVRPGGKGFSIFVNPGPNGKPNAAGLFVPGAPDYPFKPNTMNTASGQGLANVVEPGRIQGQFVTQQMGETMKGMGLIDQQSMTGDRSTVPTPDPKDAPPAAPKTVSDQLAAEKARGRASEVGAPTVTGSARVADQDAGRPTAGGKTEQGQLEDKAAREHVHTAFRNMFVQLSRALDNPKVDLFTDSAKDQALKRVATAFQQWALKSFPHDPKKFNAAEVKALTAALKAKIMAFLQTIN
ncbi:MAG TPA: hypothetical protein VLI06_03310, partial [Solimonas sp.]|nr:hypothetical protein [Solimonas sp.]